MSTAHGGVGGELDEVIVVGAQADLEHALAERLGEALGRGDGRRGAGWEVELDEAVGRARGREEAALGVEAGDRGGRDQPALPEHVGARKRGVAAQRDLDRRSEPAEIVRSVGAGDEEGGLGEVHLGGDGGHPGRFARGGQQADGGRVAAEGGVCKGIDLGNGESHQENDDRRASDHVKALPSSLRSRYSRGVYDRKAYRRHLLARLLHVAGAGSAAIVAVAASDCGARSALPVGATSRAATGAGGAGGSVTGLGGSTPVGGFGGGILLGAASSSSNGAVTVGAGGAPTDGGPYDVTVCLGPAGVGECLPTSGVLGNVKSVLPGCLEAVAVISGPTGENDACCYEVEVQPFPCYVGRTFFVDEGVVKADLRPGRSWRAGRGMGQSPGSHDGSPGGAPSSTLTPDVATMPAATRRALAEAWARDGLFEHASVASFSRFAMQLLALGAPADLVRDTHAAAIDEVRHAELCLDLASAYFGESVEPAALPVPGPLAIVPDLAAIAAEVVMEGCIGETVATVQALDALAAATDPAVREVLEVTIADETRHADLAWRFVAWAIDQGGDAVREAVLRAFAGFRPPEARVETFAGVDLALYAEHGRQQAVEGRRIAETVMAEIVQPAMCVLLSARRAAGVGRGYGDVRV